MSASNPFEASDKESNPFDGSLKEYSSGDDGVFDTNDFAKIFETNDNAFHFEKWIDEYNLKEIMDCFKDHDMISLQTLNLNNPNFSKLMADQRVILKAHLIQNIVNGIQSLSALRQSQANEASDYEGKEGVLPQTAATSPSPKKAKPVIILMGENETKTFKNMEQYIENLSNLRNELNIVTQQDFEIVRDRNYEQIEQYEDTHLTKLDEISDKIRKTFETLHETVDKTKQRLLDKVNTFEEEIKDIKTGHDQLADVIDGKYEHCLSIIDTDNNIFKESMIESKDIIKKYDDANVDDDINNDAFSFKNIHKTREQEIIEIGNVTKNKYEQTMLLLDDEQNQMDGYIKSEMNLDQNEMYSISVHSKFYNIDRDLNQLIQISDGAQKQNIESDAVIEDRKMEPNDDEIKKMDEDNTQQIINKDDIVENEVDVNGVFCVEFTRRPLGLTFGTNEEKTNLFVTTIDENSIGFKANVSIGSKMIKLQDEVVEDLGSPAIYKLLNNKFGKVLPLKITFKRSNEVDDIKFDTNWFNEEKWELDDDDKTIKGIDYDPFTVYCLYFANDGYSKGIHYLTVKGTKLNEEQGNIKCCIGVISEKNRDWSKKGINDNWPKIGLIGTYSYFDGWAEDPYWYSSEAITVKLDMTNLMVHYFTVHQSKQKLIKKEKIKKAKTYHFMMCADSDPTVEYMIK